MLSPVPACAGHGGCSLEPQPSEAMKEKKGAGLPGTGAESTSGAWGLSVPPKPGLHVETESRVQVGTGVRPGDQARVAEKAAHWARACAGAAADHETTCAVLRRISTRSSSSGSRLRTCTQAESSLKSGSPLLQNSCPSTSGTWTPMQGSLSTTSSHLPSTA